MCHYTIIYMITHHYKQIVGRVDTTCTTINAALALESWVGNNLQVMCCMHIVFYI